MSPASHDPLTPGRHRRTISVASVQRKFILQLPDAVAEMRPLPVLLVFHGGGSTAEGMIDFCGLDQTAREKQFIAVFPQGTGRVPEARSFNAGSCCGYAARHQVDDVGFVRTLLDWLVQSLPVDPQRIYSTGMSNGGMMSYRLACEMSERIAAIAPVGGPLGIDDCTPSRPVPVCHFHGTRDEFAPFDGGRGARSLSRAQFRSVPETVERWIEFNRCAAEPDVEDLPPGFDDGTRVTRYRYAPAAGDGRGAEVILYKIHGAGHTWPGRESRYDFLGPTTRNLVANDVLWDFLKRFRRKA